MNLHEYQAKRLLADYQIAVPIGAVISQLDEVPSAVQGIVGDKWVVKAQVHAGGRGKAGGVAVLSSVDAVEQMVKKLLGSRLVTFQTDEKGQPINKMLIEQVCDIDSELYLGVVIDRVRQRIVVMASTEGGMAIEEVAEATPEKIIKAVINPVVGVMPYQIRQLAFALKLSKDLTKQFAKLLTNVIALFRDKDLSLLEINPLVITKDEKLLCLDAKINIDSNALYRQSELLTLRDLSQEDERELIAQDWDLNYIALDGSVGCMVNGAGLAMATMDLIKLHGGEPANFLDVGGGATAERVAQALKIILSDSKVKSVLINIFGGIVRCDLIAEGIIQAVNQIGVNVPLIVRLVGNNAKLGLDILAKCDCNIEVAGDLTKAAKLAIRAAGEKS